MSVSVTLTACRLPGGVGGVAAIAVGTATRVVSVAAAIAAALNMRIDPLPWECAITGEHGRQCARNHGIRTRSTGRSDAAGVRQTANERRQANEPEPRE